MNFVDNVKARTRSIRLDKSIISLTTSFSPASPRPFATNPQQAGGLGSLTDMTIPSRKLEGPAAYSLKLPDTGATDLATSVDDEPKAPDDEATDADKRTSSDQRGTESSAATYADAEERDEPAAIRQGLPF